MPPVHERLADKLKNIKLAQQPTTPLWEGPAPAGRNSGVTQGLLGRYLVDPERARIRLIEGLRPVETFKHTIEYGQMFHLCCEVAAQVTSDSRRASDGAPTWRQALKTYARALCERDPTQQEQVDHWYNVCLVQFPLYQEFYRQRPDKVPRNSLLQEQEFSVPYKLPSGRVVRLRGKWDDIGVAADGIWITDHKTKGDIDETGIKRQLTFDLQTMLYAIALECVLAVDPETPTPHGDYAPLYRWMNDHEHAHLAGVRLNVVRRPLSGGKGSIVRGKGTQGSKCPKCKGTGRQGYHPTCPKCQGVGRINAKPPESKEAFYSRVQEIITAEPATYFMRWDCLLRTDDITKFRRESLDPVLENLYDDWEWWEWCYRGKGGTAGSIWDATRRHKRFPHHYPRHYRLPYGVSSPLLEGGFTDVDMYMESGNAAGLQRTDTLFPELKRP